VLGLTEQPRAWTGNITVTKNLIEELEDMWQGMRWRATCQDVPIRETWENSHIEDTILMKKTGVAPCWHNEIEDAMIRWIDNHAE